MADQRGYLEVDHSLSGAAAEDLRRRWQLRNLEHIIGAEWPIELPEVAFPNLLRRELYGQHLTVHRLALEDVTDIALHSQRSVVMQLERWLERNHLRQITAIRVQARDDVFHGHRIYVAEAFALGIPPAPPRARRRRRWPWTRLRSRYLQARLAYWRRRQTAGAAA